MSFCVLHFPNGASVGVDTKRLSDFGYLRIEIANQGGPVLPRMADDSWFGAVVAPLLIEAADAERNLIRARARDLLNRTKPKKRKTAS